MNRWINRYGTVAILLLLILVMNPELRAFLLLATFIGLDLMIFFIVIQLRYLLSAIPSYPYQMGGFLCVAGYTALRVTTLLSAYEEPAPIRSIRTASWPAG
jgi:hypothetical protein